MLRKVLMTTVAASAMVGFAYAADLPSRRPPPSAYVPPVPIFTWTGFYVGVNGGGMFRANNRDDFANAVFFGGAAPFGGLVAANNNNNGRFLVGGQAGVNWQINQFVLGIEGDGQAVLGGNNNVNNLGFFGNNNGNNIGFLGTVRGRGGIAFDRFLVYGTGGVAFGDSNNRFGNTFIGTVGGIPTIFASNTNNSTRVGYTVGAGAEYAFLNNWSVKVEYLFVDLGRNNRTFLDPVTGAGFAINHREQDHVIRAGLNYRFNWGFGAAPGPVVASY